MALRLDLGFAFAVRRLGFLEDVDNVLALRAVSGSSRYMHIYVAT
jgi:hypothetical protein